MLDLKMEVEKSADKLRAAWTGLQGVVGSSLPQKCNEHWIKRAALYRVLSGTATIFPARQAAWEIVQAANSPSSVIDAGRNLVKHGTLEMDFSIARHLALTSYVAVTWSVYDRLTNVCGRLAGVAEIAENPKLNPKACEDLLGKKDILGFATHMHIQHAYRWPLKAAYKIRNWLVHEGYEENSTPLFKGDRIADGFILHDDAIDYLEKCCGYNADNGKIDGCCLAAAEECWPTRDMLIVLEQYHAEVDELFAGLLKWSVDSFIGQITIFSGRDRPH